MKRTALIALFCVVMASALVAETAIVTEGWIRLRSAPGKNAKAIGLLYGNDAYPVLKKKDGWVQVRTAKGQVGWVPEDKLVRAGKSLKSSASPRQSLARAIALQRRGFRKEAQQALRDIADDFPGTIEQYEAIRHLLFYFPVSMLPEPINGRVHPASVMAAERLEDILVDCAGYTPRPPPRRFWQLEYVLAGFTPRSGAFPTEFPRSNCP